MFDHNIPQTIPKKNLAAELEHFEKIQDDTSKSPSSVRVKLEIYSPQKTCQKQVTTSEEGCPKNLFLTDV